MNQGRDQFRPVGIFRRIFDLVMKTISALALKSLTLGCPVYCGVAFCHRLFNSIMQTLAAQAIKPVILGSPVHPPLAPVCISGESEDGCSSTSDQNVPPMTHPLPCEMVSPSAKVEPEQVLAIENISTEVVPAPTFAAQARAPKKMVSINDRVEEIYPEKKKERKKSTEKLPSMEREKDEQKPLKSILKMRSNVKDEGSYGA